MSDPRDARELRLAIAIRGGVSLAVWMGGAVREVVRLHAASRSGSGTYARLLVACEYSEDGETPEPVTIDVLAGTSAGGLNAALLAAHLVYGVPFDEGIRDVWLQVGDLELLSRSPAERSPPSLLEGDRGFYDQMQIELHKLADAVRVDPSDEQDPLQSLRLILTATRLESRADALRPDLGNALVFDDSRAHFRFRYRHDVDTAGAQGPLSDFGLDDESRNATLDRLAYAARSTSSFPGAFEPARIRVGDQEHGNVDSSGLPLDFHGVSSETIADNEQTGHAVELIDGGVLDNIPIDWALRAIAGSPATRPVDRWLLYLEPVPKESKLRTRKFSPSERRVTRLVQLVASTMGTRGQASSMLRNADQFRSGDEEVSRLTALADTGALSAGAAAVVKQASPAPRIATYQAQVRTVEGTRSQRLLEDPLSVIGPDPLAVPALDYPLVALDWAGLSTRFLTELCPAVGVLAFPDAADLTQVRTRTVSPLPIARAVTLLGDWLRSVEQPRQPVAPELRERLYEARFVAEVLVAVADRLLVQEVQRAVDEWERDGRRGPPADATLPPQIDPRAIAAKARASFVAVLSWVSMPASFDQPWHTWATALALLLPTLSEPEFNPAGDGLGAIWGLLAQLAVDIGAAAKRTPPEPSDPFAALREAATDPEHALERSLEVLTAAEVLIGPLRSQPLAEPTATRFAALSAAVSSPLERIIFTEPRPKTARERVDRKLSGNQVHNFAAFVSSRWRLNDWVWGRLDAARSLAEIIVEHRREEFTAAEIEKLFCDGDLDPEWRTLLEGEWKRFAVEPGTDVGRDRVVEIVTARLQWEILAEEMPLMAELTKADKRFNDQPPTATMLADAKRVTRLVEPPSPDDAADRVTPDDVRDTAKDFGLVGSETVKELTRKRDLRRSILRLGLVAWRALLPSGTGIGAHLARGALFILEPIVWLPLLFAIAAPVATVAAGLFTLAAVSITVNHWVSQPGDLVIFTGMFLALGVYWWQHWKKKPSVWAIAGAVVVVVAVYAGSVVVWLTVHAPVTHLDDITRAGIAAGCVLFATVLPLGWVIKPKNVGSVLLVAFIVVVSAGLAFLAAWYTAYVGDEKRVQGWLVLLVLYVPLAAEAVVLYRRYPASDRRVTRPPAPAPET